MTEIEENICLHSGRANDGVVGFRGTKEEFEFVVADSGMGMLTSLRRSPDYADLEDTGKALLLALQDSQSRLRYMGNDHGYGFKNLFRTLATLNGELRFRSDDQAVTIDGVAPELAKSELRQKTRLQGFCASIVRGQEEPLRAASCSTSSLNASSREALSARKTLAQAMQ